MKLQRQDSNVGGLIPKFQAFLPNNRQYTMSPFVNATRSWGYVGRRKWEKLLEKNTTVIYV
jgi:hypothetical protein